MAVKSDPDLGVNSWLEDELYQQYLHDHGAVDDSWKQLFENGGGDGAPAAQSPKTPEEPAQSVPAENRLPMETPAAAPGLRTAPAPGLQPEKGAAVEEMVPLRGAAARIAENMEASVSIPTATSQRTIPVKVIDENKNTVPLDGRRIAIQEHGEPSPELYAALRERGAQVSPVHVYRWELPEDTGPLKNAVQAVCTGQVDVVMFTSSVQLTHAMKIASELGLSSEFKAGLNAYLDRNIPNRATYAHLWEQVKAA